MEIIFFGLRNTSNIWVINMKEIGRGSIKNTSALEFDGDSEVRTRGVWYRNYCAWRGIAVTRVTEAHANAIFGSRAACRVCRIKY